MSKIYHFAKDERGRWKSTKRASDPCVDGVNVFIQALRAGQLEMTRLGWQDKAARLKARAERRQETRTKLVGLVLGYAMAACMVFFLVAGVHG